MAFPSVSFTDDVGLATITSVTRRFRNWIPDVDIVGPSDTALGLGTTHTWEFRRDYFATFELPNILAAELDKLIRLKAHLINNGNITVNTADLAARSYTCRMRPKQLPSWDLDAEFIEYTLKLNVVNIAAAPMICVYRA